MNNLTLKDNLLKSGCNMSSVFRRDLMLFYAPLGDKYLDNTRETYCTIRIPWRESNDALGGRMSSYLFAYNSDLSLKKEIFGDVWKHFRDTYIKKNNILDFDENLSIGIVEWDLLPYSEEDGMDE